MQTMWISKWNTSGIGRDLLNTCISSLFRVLFLTHAVSNLLQHTFFVLSAHDECTLPKRYKPPLPAYLTTTSPPKYISFAREQGAVFHDCLSNRHLETDKSVQLLTVPKEDSNHRPTMHTHSWATRSLMVQGVSQSLGHMRICQLFWLFFCILCGACASMISFIVDADISLLQLPKM